MKKIALLLISLSASFNSHAEEGFFQKLGEAMLRPNYNNQGQLYNQYGQPVIVQQAQPVYGQAQGTLVQGANGQEYLVVPQANGQSIVEPVNVIQQPQQSYYAQPQVLQNQ